MQTEGRDIGSAARRAGSSSCAPIRGRATSDSRFVGQVDLMRTTFSGLGLAIGLAIMVVFMIMASQFKSLRLPFIMLFTIPVSLLGHRAGADRGGPGLLDHGAHGRADGRRHRGVERHPADRRRQPPLQRRRRQGRGGHRRGAHAVHPDRHDQPGDGDRPGPDGAGARRRAPSRTSRSRSPSSAA